MIPTHTVTTEVSDTLEFRDAEEQLKFQGFCAYIGKLKFDSC